MIRRRPNERRGIESNPAYQKKFKSDGSKKADDDAQALLEEDDRQEGLASEMLRLVSSLKHNFTTAGSVLKEDNAVRNFN
jgi:hypothetical protein